MSSSSSNARPKPDAVLTDIADYVLKTRITSKAAFDTARFCLLDTLGCGFEALTYPACTKLLGPVVPGTDRAQRRARSRHASSSSIRSRRPSTSAQ